MPSPRNIDPYYSTTHVRILFNFLFLFGKTGTIKIITDFVIHDGGKIRPANKNITAFVIHDGACHLSLSLSL